MKVESEKSESEQELESEDTDETEDEYPHHSAREGTRYQADVKPFDPALSIATQKKRTPQIVCGILIEFGKKIWIRLFLFSQLMLLRMFLK